MSCRPLRCRNCGHALIAAREAEELAMLLTVFDVRVDAVFKCSGCGAEHLLKARKNTIEWTTIIPEKTRKGTKPRTEPAPCNGPNPNPEIDAGRDETA